MRSVYTVREVQQATIGKLIDDSRGRAESFPYEDILTQANVSLVPGCSLLGIPIIARFGGFLEPPVPEEIASQLRGREYGIGMEVEYNGKSSIVVFLAIMPGDEFPIDRYDPDYDSVERFRIEPGRMIPRDCKIQMLRLAPSDWIFSAN